MKKYILFFLMVTVGLFVVKDLAIAAPDADLVSVTYPTSVNVNESFEISIKAENPGTDLDGFGTVTLSLESDDGFDWVNGWYWDGDQVLNDSAYTDGVYYGIKDGDYVVEGIEIDWEGDHWYNINGEDHTLDVYVSAPSSGGNIHFYVRVTFTDPSWQVIDNDPTSSSYRDWANYVYRYTINVVEPDSIPPGAPGTPDMDNDDDTGNSDTDEVTYDSSPWFNWSAASDNSGGSGIAGYYWAIDDYTPETGGEYETSTSAHPSGISDGSHYIYVKAVDNEGNVGPYSRLQFDIDTVAPSVPSDLHVDQGNPTTDQTPILDWSDVPVTYRYYVEIENYLGSNYWSGYVSGSSYQVQSALPLGTIYWKVYAEDDAGNKSSFSSRSSFEIVEPFTVTSVSFTVNDDSGTPDETYQQILNFNGTGNGQIIYQIESLPPGGAWESSGLNHPIDLIDGSATAETVLNFPGEPGEYSYRCKVTTPEEVYSNEVAITSLAASGSPDLIVNNFELKQSYVNKLRGPLQFSVTIENIGDGASLPTYVGFYLSQDSNFDGDEIDPLLSMEETPALEGNGGSITYDLNYQIPEDIQIPANIDRGIYCLIAKADFADEDQAEYDESNNQCSSRRIGIVDLTPGVTVLAHGFNPSGDGAFFLDDFNPINDYWNKDRTFIESILYPFGGGIVKVYDPDSGAFIIDDDIEKELKSLNLYDPEGHVILVHNWAEASNDPISGQAEAAAEALLVALVDPDGDGLPENDFITFSGEGNHLTKPAHFIGHSRGTVVVSEVVQRLGVYGINVDYVTYLDPHDFNEDDVPLDEFFHDPAVQVWTNNSYVDNFWQETYFLTPVIPSGRSLSHLGSDSYVFNRELTHLDGFDIPIANTHGKVIDWYLGTISPNYSINPTWYYAGAGFDTGFSYWALNGGFNGLPPNGIVSQADPITFAKIIAFPGDENDYDDNMELPQFFNGFFALGDLLPTLSF
ncbi:hypothetical protein KAR91_29660, partial [Candidatus Pacearchaeota archaeon]|nr:hypothetical protein [Candidatus Pacearchaeota archaeon]